MGGLGKFRDEDDFGIKMPSMGFDKGQDLYIDSAKVIQNFNDEEMIRKDEEEAQQ